MSSSWAVYLCTCLPTTLITNFFTLPLFPSSCPFPAQVFVSSWVDCKRVLRYRISRETTIRVIIILLLTPEESNKERHTGSPRLVRSTQDNDDDDDNSNECPEINKEVAALCCCVPQPLFDQMDGRTKEEDERSCLTHTHSQKGHLQATGVKKAGDGRRRVSYSRVLLLNDHHHYRG